MINQNQEPQYHNNTFSVLIALFIGGLAGAVAMLFLAPQSGEDTRLQLQKKGMQLFEQTSDLTKDSLMQVRKRANKLTVMGGKKFRELKKQGQELAVEQLDQVSKAAKAGKKAIKSS
jgi:gas vesicle protein